MRFSTRVLVLLTCVFICSVSVAADCLPEGYTRAGLRELAAREFKLEDDATRQGLALNLLACLSDPDPEIRDDIAYRAYVYWMRNKGLTTETLRTISSRLQSELAAPKTDTAGFRKPFAALVLSELARTDRKDPWMSPAERSELIINASNYVISVRDYRGFDEHQGWRHGVAHGSDLLMQLSLNNALEKSQLDMILAAVASQAGAHDGHTYIYGEAERLAAPVYYIAKRKLHSLEEWQSWLAALAKPMPPLTAETLYKSKHGLGWRQNTMNFLSQLYIAANEDKDEEVKALLLPATKEALKALP